jgi:hypothetical protein
MELIVFIADSAAAVYFLFVVGVDAPHRVFNIVNEADDSSNGNDDAATK